MPDDLTYMPALEMKRRIAAKELSPVELTESALARLRETEPALNSFVTVTQEIALEAARAAEAAVMKGEATGLLHGLPVSVKDLIAMKDVKCAYGSRLMADNVATVDAPAVGRIRAHGGAIVGKTTTSEFGCKAVGDCPLTGITRNPWNTAKTPGGSSGGAGASIAAGVTPFGLGTDGGGSVRIPAAFSGLFTIKPQLGRIPVYPASGAPTLSHTGPMSRTVRDSALLLAAISGYDARDFQAVAGPVPDFLAACDRPVKGMRAAWSPTYGYAKPEPEVLAQCEEAVKALEAQGCEVELVEHVMDDPADIWMAEFYLGAGGRLRDVLKTDKRDLLDPSVVAAASRALAQSMEHYCAMASARHALRDKLRLLFEKYDLLLSPTLPVPPFDVGLDAPPRKPGDDAVAWVAYTYPFNLNGYPAASVPAGFTSDKLPVGLQIVGGPLREDDVFAASAALEEARPWAHETPPI